MINLVLLALGCTSQDVPRDPLHPTGSSTLATSADRRTVGIVNPDDGAVTWLDPRSGDARAVEVGEGPTRIARFGEDYLVTLRYERAVVRIASRSTGRVEVDRLATGPEPYGVVADEAGERAWVAVSQGGEVIEIEGGSSAEGAPGELRVVRRWPVRGEPRWLALHPSERALFVASARGGVLSRIDLDTGAITEVELPRTERPTREGVVALTTRLTGDPTITPEGDVLAVPAIMIDHTSPVVVDPEDEDEGGSGYAGTGTATVERFNPVLLQIPLRRGDGAVVNGGASDGESGPGAVFLAVPARRLREVRSYPSSATASPNGHDILVTMEASDAVVVTALMSVRHPRFGGVEPGGFLDTGGEAEPIVPPREGGFVERPLALVHTGRGPRGVAFTSDTDATVHEFLADSASKLDYNDAEDAVSGAADDGFAGRELSATGSVRIVESTLPPDVHKGRDLFHSAVDNRMVAKGGGVSCSTCHFEGRDDGLTWMFTIGPRQTPSLAGRVSSTTPVTWTEEVASVALEAQLTTELRMGGKGLELDLAERVAAYIDHGGDVDVGSDLGDRAAVERGRALFAREDVGCASCHLVGLYTDNRSHALYGLDRVNTPTLVGLSASAPYLHDGSAGTLRELLQGATAGGMGDTSALSAAELDDLETFLRSL